MTGLEDSPGEETPYRYLCWWGLDEIQEAGSEERVRLAYRWQPMVLIVRR